MRDTKEMALQGMEIMKKNQEHDMTVNELDQLLEYFTPDKMEANGSFNQLYYAINEAFYMGVAAGSRCRG